MDPLAPHAPSHRELPHRELDLPVLTSRTSQLLREHVPLTLLLDLAEDDGPRSEVRYAQEGGDADWLIP